MFKYNIRGENIEVTDAIREYVKKRIDTVDKYFSELADVRTNVNLRVYPTKQAKAEVTIFIPHLTLRAESTTWDLYESIDNVVDKLESQIRKYKTKINKHIRSKQRKHRENEEEIEQLTQKAEVEDFIVYNEDLKDQEFNIVRSKNIKLAPMSVEEAILRMNMLEHDFYMFIDEDTAEISMVYVRTDGRYGVISAR